MATAKYTKDEFFNEIYRIYQLRGTMNTQILKEELSFDISLNAYLHKYGGLKQICKELDIPFTHALRSNPEDVKLDFMRVYQDLGYINTEIYLKYGKYSKQSIKTAFGSVNNLMRILNIPLNTSRMDNRDQIAADIRRIYEEYKTSSSNIYRKHGLYSESVVNRVFGSWRNALSELNIPPVYDYYGVEQIIKQLTTLYNKYGFLSRSIIDNECEFSYQALAFWFKNKEGICKAIGIPNAFHYQGSAQAEVLRRILCQYFPDTILEHTWDWLINDQTSRCMYVDFYIPSINIAIEYDGEQHFCFSPFLHGDEETFKAAIYRDQLKDSLLAQHNIPLIRFTYKHKLTESFVLDFINSLIQ